MISIPTLSITISTLKFGFCNSISAFWYEHIIIFPKTWAKQLYTICILSFCCLSRSNAKTQDVMLASTQETLLISDSIIGTFFNHQKDSCIYWPAMLWTVEAIGYKLVFTDISVWLYNCLHIPELLAISHFITRVLDYKIGLLLSTRHNIHHQVKWHCLKSIGEEMWMMWPGTHQCTDYQLGICPDSIVDESTTELPRLNSVIYPVKPLSSPHTA
jgi:hypothetical protein